MIHSCCPTINVSVGELFDKYSILQIKKEHSTDKNKSRNIINEMNQLYTIIKQYDISTGTSEQLYTDLKKINETLWNVEDSIRIKEMKQEFNDEFILLSRKVYMTNDKRHLKKKEINLHFSSFLTEEKIFTQNKNIS